MAVVEYRLTNLKLAILHRYGYFRCPECGMEFAVGMDVAGKPIGRRYCRKCAKEKNVI